MTGFQARGVFVGVVIAVGVVTLAASVQDWTQRPGEATQGRVWIQNRGQSEAVPVSVVSSGAPLPVQLAGTPVVITGPESVVQARATRQVWDYRQVRIAAGQDPEDALARHGLDGWETTGLAFPSAGETVVIMKRPR